MARSKKNNLNPPLEETKNPPLEETKNPPLEETKNPPLEETKNPPIEETESIEIEFLKSPTGAYKLAYSIGDKASFKAELANELVNNGFAKWTSK